MVLASTSCAANWTGPSLADTAAMTSGRVAADGAVSMLYTAVKNDLVSAVVDTAAVTVGRVAAKSAVAYRSRRRAVGLPSH